MATEIIFIRHGETDWNRTGRYQGQRDIELSETGHKQAQKLAAGLNIGRPAAIYSSDLQRARQTAGYLSAKYQLPIKSSSLLREINFGQWEGMAYRDIIADWPEEAQNLTASPERLKIPGGESLLEVQQRANEIISQICNEYPNDVVIVVTHGAFIKIAIATVLQMSLNGIWRFDTKNTSITKIKYYQESNFQQLLLLNDTHHLSN